MTGTGTGYPVAWKEPPGSKTMNSSMSKGRIMSKGPVRRRSCSGDYSVGSKTTKVLKTVES